MVCCGGKWTYQGFGSEVVSSFRVDVDKGKWSWFCCPGETKEYVIRDSDGYGEVENLDILLDQIDKILTVITLVLFSREATLELAILVSLSVRPSIHL